MAHQNGLQTSANRNPDNPDNHRPRLKHMDELFNNNATSKCRHKVDPKAAYEALVGEGKKYATNELLAA